MVNLSKIKFDRFSFRDDGNGRFSNINISGCVFSSYLWFASGKSFNNVLVSNSIISQIGYSVNSNSSALVANSIIYSYDNLDNPYNHISLQNNIIVLNNCSQIPSSVYNNIFTGANNFPNVDNQTGNWENVNLSGFFEN